MVRREAANRKRVEGHSLPARTNDHEPSLSSSLFFSPFLSFPFLATPARALLSRVPSLPFPLLLCRSLARHLLDSLPDAPLPTRTPRQQRRRRRWRRRRRRDDDDRQRRQRPRTKNFILEDSRRTTHDPFSSSFYPRPIHVVPRNRIRVSRCPSVCPLLLYTSKVENTPS